MSQPDENLCCFGAEAILKRIEATLRLGPEVRRNKDVEAVHDMRVASRRARTALDLFCECFPARKARRWNKRLKRVTRALGQARDLDVQIEFVRGFLKAVSDRNLRPGIRRLLLRLRQQRDRLQAEVVAVLDRFETHEDLADMQAVVLQQIAHGHLHQLQATSGSIHQHARPAISARLEQMLAYEPYIERPECIAQLHEMRIAAKHLRYAMEILDPLYQDMLDEWIDVAKGLQRRLGEIHDCDVWVQFLPSFVEQERQRTVEYFGREGSVNRLLPGIEHLRQRRQMHRDACYHSFVASWQQLQTQGIWGRLLALLERHADLPAGDAAGQPADQEPKV